MPGVTCGACVICDCVIWSFVPVVLRERGVGRGVDDADACAELKSETDTCYFDDFDKPGVKMRGRR